MDHRDRSTRPRQGRLLRKYAIVFGALVGGTLVAGSVIQLYFSYQANQAAILRIERVEASRAALSVSHFVDAMRAHVARILPTPGLTDVPLEQRQVDFHDLQRDAPEVTELRFIDKTGREQVFVSRLELNEIGKGIDRSHEAEFVQTRTGQTYYAPVDFRQGSEPFFRIAVPEGKDDGVTVATVNLRFALDSVSAIKFGEVGHAYVVDGSGRLIAHPDISLVLGRRDLSSTPQVQAALKPSQSPREQAMTARNPEGLAVLTAWEVIPSTGWAVFVEQPLDEAFGPLTSSLWRSAGILALGLALALLASVALSRRMIEPIEAIRASASRIGEGALGERIRVSSGDELEDLADDFNEMAARLGESYATLEQKVEDRTRDLANANRQIEMASRNKSEFLANMSHELRTPLNAIIGFSELLLEETSGQLNATHLQYVRDILSSGRHQLAVINDVLDLSKVEAGRLELERTTFDPSQTIADAVAFVRARATQRGIHLVEPVDGELGQIDADERKLKQVIVNLLSNAVKFTPSGGQVSVNGTRANGEIVISVSDTGPGISKEELGGIFREFAQTASARGHEGTGLGLALAKRIAELHGGRISVESAPGKGSTFTVVLPVVAAG